MEPMRSFVDGYVMSMSIGCGLFIRYMLLRLSINMCILCGYFRCWLQLAIWHIALHEVCLDHGNLLQVACFFIKLHTTYPTMFPLPFLYGNMKDHSMYMFCRKFYLKGGCV